VKNRHSSLQLAHLERPSHARRASIDGFSRATEAAMNDEQALARISHQISEGVVDWKSFATSFFVLIQGAFVGVISQDFETRPIS
jgi:hypothetical protein